ncbi:hypothetical protein SK128_011434, partial [Halocaridina rubra]
VEILIGLDHPWALLPLEVRWGGDRESFVLRTALGWTVQGALLPRDTMETATILTAIADLPRSTSGNDYLEQR